MNLSARLFDFWARAEKGDRVEEKQFTLKVFWKNLKKITEQYQIQYDSQQIVPMDDDLINRIFIAGKDLLLKTGIYCRNTERIIWLTPAEIEDSVRLISDNVYIGKGNDKVKIKHRGLDPVFPPAVFLFPSASACP